MTRKDVINTVDNLTPIEIALNIDNEGYTTTKNLYSFLGLDTSNYSRWIKNNILDNQFAEEGIDYFHSSSKTSKRRGKFADGIKNQLVG